MIKYLETEAELRQVAEWLFSEWGYSLHGVTIEMLVERLRPRLGSTKIPICFVANDGEMVGTACLVDCDMSTHPELKPWLASLYVRADRRGQGVGDALLSCVVAEVARLGFAKCYLWTDKAEAFYAKRGWRVVLREEYRGETAIVMERGV